MNNLKPILLGLSLAVACAPVVAAQEPAGPPKILQITREFIKPYKSGMAHDKTEGAFITAMTKAKFPVYYVGLNSMSGKSRGLYLTGYDSFAEWEKDNKLVDKNPALGSELERASLADGELLEGVDSEVFTYSPEVSYKPHGSLAGSHYVEISVFHVRPGRRADWNKLAKIVKDAHDKAGDSAHWAAFELAYGADDGTWAIITGHKSLAGIDTEFSEDKGFRDALGEEGMKQLDKLYGETVDTSHSEIFSVNPKQSYVSPDWISADPDFWKPKPMAAPAAKAAPAKKPAQ
jgi:hypothetical protein